MRAGRLAGEHKGAKRTQTTTVTAGYRQCPLSRKHVRTDSDFIRLSKVCLRASKCVLIIYTVKAYGHAPSVFMAMK